MVEIYLQGLFVMDFNALPVVIQKPRGQLPLGKKGCVMAINSTYQKTLSPKIWTMARHLLYKFSTFVSIAYKGNSVPLENNGKVNLCCKEVLNYSRYIPCGLWC
jgi:hypothetical protein